MPDRQIPSLRRALANMAAPPVSGHVEIHIDGGVAVRCKVRHPLHPQFGRTPSSAANLSPQAEAVVAIVQGACALAYAERMSCHLLITVVEGVPCLPVEIEYVTSEPEADIVPRVRGRARPSYLAVAK